MSCARVPPSLLYLARPAVFVQTKKFLSLSPVCWSSCRHPIAAGEITRLLRARGAVVPFFPFVFFFLFRTTLSPPRTHQPLAERRKNRRLKEKKETTMNRRCAPAAFRARRWSVMPSFFFTTASVFFSDRKKCSSFFFFDGASSTTRPGESDDDGPKKRPCSSIKGKTKRKKRGKSGTKGSECE
ncbi:hypothetical protein [Pandoravirus japonicus]|uniref:Uncharacterized protein n=1 Tax=Pandoravirus japonicus TaxID=2823154 RepID=A0A811BLS5_9VIRU|nr:hypothetical protein [Pandoravirus japonicus]